MPPEVVPCGFSSRNFWAWVHEIKKAPVRNTGAKVYQPARFRLNGITLSRFCACHRRRAKAEPAFEAADLRRLLRRFGAALFRQRLRARLRSLPIIDLSRSTNRLSLVSAIMAGSSAMRPKCPAQVLCAPRRTIARRRPIQDIIGRLGIAWRHPPSAAWRRIACWAPHPLRAGFAVSLRAARSPHRTSPPEP